MFVHGQIPCFSDFQWFLFWFSRFSEETHTLRYYIAIDREAINAGVAFQVGDVAEGCAVNGVGADIPGVGGINGFNHYGVAYAVAGNAVELDNAITNRAAIADNQRIGKKAYVTTGLCKTCIAYRGVIPLIASINQCLSTAIGTGDIYSRLIKVRCAFAENAIILPAI